MSLGSMDVSQAKARVDRVVERAIKVFGNQRRAKVWLETTNGALLGVTPISLIDTEIGAEEVMNTLGRIEHGVFA